MKWWPWMLQALASIHIVIMTMLLHVIPKSWLFGADIATRLGCWAVTWRKRQRTCLFPGILTPSCCLNLLLTPNRFSNFNSQENWISTRKPYNSFCFVLCSTKIVYTWSHSCITRQHTTHTHNSCLVLIALSSSTLPIPLALTRPARVV